MGDLSSGIDTSTVDGTVTVDVTSGKGADEAGMLSAGVTSIAVGVATTIGNVVGGPALGIAFGSVTMGVAQDPEAALSFALEAGKAAASAEMGLDPATGQSLDSNPDGLGAPGDTGSGGLALGEGPDANDGQGDFGGGSDPGPGAAAGDPGAGEPGGGDFGGGGDPGAGAVSSGGDFGGGGDPGAGAVSSGGDFGGGSDPDTGGGATADAGPGAGDAAADASAGDFGGGSDPGTGSEAGDTGTGGDPGGDVGV